MIKLDKITIEGFGSIYNRFVYFFDSPGINLILGENGVGKTTIINALVWCVYKQTLKKGCTIEPWPHTITKKYKGVMVEVTFSDEFGHRYRIVRCKDYTGSVQGVKGKGGNGLFFFFEDELVKDKYKSNIQPKIEKTIGYSFNLFKNAVLFGQEMERLMKESGPNKRKVLEEAFDTSFIDVAKEKVQKRLAEREKVEIVLSSKVDKFANHLEDFDSTTKNMVRVTKDHINTYKEQIREYRKEIKELDSWLSTNNQDIEGQIKEIEKKIDKVQAKINPNLSDEEFRLNMWINNTQQSYENVWDEIKETLANFKSGLSCSKCNRPFEKKHIAVHRQRIKKDLKKLKAEANKLSQSIKEQKKKYEDVKLQISNQSSLSDKLSVLKNSLSEARQAERKIIPKITQLKSRRDVDVPALKKNIQTLKKQQLVLKENRGKEKQDIEKKLKIANEELSHITKKVNIDKWLINDPLSNTGIKAYVFDSMLSDVNKHLEKYQSQIGFGIRINVDLESARKDIGISITKKTDEVPYEDLSKGQKQLTDLVLAFAINDTLTENKPINALFFDELFESLSKNNVEIVGNIIMEKSINRSIHLITHHSGFQPTGSKKILLQLDNEEHTVKVGA